MATIERNDVALTVAEWAHAVRNNKEIRDEVKKTDRLNYLAVSDCTFANSASGITHLEYLHLRTVWYRYGSDRHLDDFAKLLRDNPQTGYKGFVSPRNHERAQQLVLHKSPYLRKYLEEFKKREWDEDYLHASPDCGFFTATRYWQTLVTTHTKGSGTAGSKIFKPQAQEETEETRGRPTTPAGQQASGGPSTMATPTRQILSASRSPPKFETPAATSHPAARGGTENSPSADEAYVNNALIALAQAITQEFQGPGVRVLSGLHWVPPRLALHLTVPVVKTEKGKKIFKNKRLLEARLDGYLCHGKDDKSLDRPIAICEAKSGVRRSVKVATERQEAAEMAAWICHRPFDGLLQCSASGKKRRLMVSQDRDEVYIIIGEYGPMYERYIRNAPWKAGDDAAEPAPRLHTTAALAQSFEQTLGSPTFLRQLAKEKIEGIEGWKDTAVQAAVERVKSTLSSRDGSPPPPGGPSGSAANTGISGQLPVRPKANQAPSSDHAPGRMTKSTAAPLNLPSADGFLVMHRFGPWKTEDASNMEVFVRRLLALMLELYDNIPESHPSSRGSSAPSSRSSSTTGSRAPSVTGSRAPSATGSRAPSVTGKRAPSATGNRVPPS